jgi:chorismate mutase
MTLKVKQIKDWGLGLTKPMIIGGPCSAESEEQVVNTAKEIAALGKVNVLRAGIWKPRTRPNSFEGVGEIGLEWLNAAKKETGMLTATEVANGKHVEACLKAGVDILWVGARTTVNPFSVQEVADALKGVDVPVLVKNPINPDLALWIGGLERINQAGITRLGAIHRGFSTFEKTPFRNIPMWEMAIELKRKYPDVDIVCDPSHIAGNRDLIGYISQKALDLDMSGLMIESHITPSVALSDAAQQVTPQRLGEILDSLQVRKPSTDNVEFSSKLEGLRNDIDKIDDELFHMLSSRMKLAEQIGEYKKDNGVTILQVGRWEEIVNKRISLAKALGLGDEFVETVLKAIHKESIRRQNIVMNEAGEMAGK